MGGERSQSSSRHDCLEGRFLCEASKGQVVQAGYCVSETLDGSKSDGSTGTGVSEEIQGLCLLERTGNERRMEKRIQLQNEVLFKSSESLKDMRDKIKSYRPGDGLYEVGGISRADFAIPEVTTLLIVGPSGAGKSSLINNMIRVLDNVTSGLDRAQTYVEMGNGSLFLQEYFLYKDAKHFCVFDSRGFSDNNIGEDLDVIKKWMTDGICHGEAVCRPSDSEMIREAFEGRGRQWHSNWTVKRRVDFVMFVVNAVSVDSMRENHELLALENLATLYKSPFLSFKDDRPVVVMTHGDQLSPKDRVRTRIFIGELFGVSALDQIFDISCFSERSVNPGDVDLVNDLVLLNMLDFSLERVDRNLPYKLTAALRLKGVWGAMIDRWNELNIGLQVPLMIVIASWLFSIVLVLTAKYVVQGWKFSPVLRNEGRKHSWKWHKKIRDFRGHH